MNYRDDDLVGHLRETTHVGHALSVRSCALPATLSVLTITCECVSRELMAAAPVHWLTSLEGGQSVQPSRGAFPHHDAFLVSYTNVAHPPQCATVPFPFPSRVPLVPLSSISTSKWITVVSSSFPQEAQAPKAPVCKMQRCRSGRVSCFFRPRQEDIIETREKDEFEMCGQ